jgi:hypothetical protein
MNCREDYYKFAHKLLPKTAFKHSKPFIERVETDLDLFIYGLKNCWKSIQIDKNHKRSSVPEFEAYLLPLTEEQTLISIIMPDAKKLIEAPFIGIVYDRDHNIRYFTYEIGRGAPGQIVYFLCEWTEKGNHLNHALYHELDINNFMRGITDQLYQMTLEKAQ